MKNTLQKLICVLAAGAMAVPCGLAACGAPEAAPGGESIEGVYYMYSRNGEADDGFWFDGAMHDSAYPDGFYVKLGGDGKAEILLRNINGDYDIAKAGSSEPSAVIKPLSVDYSVEEVSGKPYKKLVFSANGRSGGLYDEDVDTVIEDGVIHPVIEEGAVIGCEAFRDTFYCKKGRRVDTALVYWSALEAQVPAKKFAELADGEIMSRVHGYTGHMSQPPAGIAYTFPAGKVASSGKYVKSYTSQVIDPEFGFAYLRVVDEPGSYSLSGDVMTFTPEGEKQVFYGKKEGKVIALFDSADDVSDYSKSTTALYPFAFCADYDPAASEAWVVRDASSVTILDKVRNYTGE